jgi:hypothetical protein
MKKIFKITFYLLIVQLFVFPSLTFASYFPHNAKTLRIANETGQDQLNKAVLPAGPLTILEITINSKDNRANTVYCAGVPMILERGSAMYFTQPMTYACAGGITADLYRTSSILITYTDYDLALIPENTVDIDGGNITVTTNGPNFQEWLFVSGVFLFFLSYIAWGLIYKPSTKLMK